jgi:peroxiredoxin
VLPLAMLLACCHSYSAKGDDKPAEDAQKKTSEAAKEATKKSAEPLAGHSMHGETFNEGPRQAAYLMEGMSNIEFEVSSSHAEAKKFFRQGVAQLHGFWYFEAERSFRQAAAMDANCAMFYWGMALANVNNRKRAEGFIEQAVKRRDNASDREKMYIDAASKRFREKTDGKKPSKKEVAEAYSQDLEAIVLKYPDDLEAKAFLALQLWENERNDLPIVSHVAINAVLQEIFDKNPLHPAHHYRIHLWDRRSPQHALASAAQCGPSLPGIAHMWHMPGHTYSNLHRYQDAVWQQEASARVDHAHMMRDRIMPDQIHNFAHNNEWMIRNLIKIGRVQDAISLASNMAQLPRHPKFNTLKSGSAKYGRERLLQTLSAYRLWDEILKAIDGGLIETGADADDQIETLRHTGIAQAMLDRAEDATKTLQELQSRLQKVDAELKAIAAEEPPALMAKRPDEGQPPAPESTKTTENKPTAAEAGAGAACELSTADDKPTEDKKADEKKPADKKAEDNSADADKKKAEANRKRREKERADKKKELEPQQKALREAVAAIEAAQASRAGQWDKAVEQFDKAGSWDKLLKVEWLAKADKLDKAIELADAEVKGNPGTVLPQAVSTFVRWQSKGAQAAKDEFEKLREAACVSDLSTPMLSRLTPLATELGVDAAWAKPFKAQNDIGPRPELDKLGPFRYSPYQAPTWEAKTRDGEPISSNQFAGKPTIVIFYLGFGCLHCMEQLQEFSPVADKFRQAGIELVGISNETPELLAKGIAKYDKPINLPLYCDSELNVFKSFRCYDDFEKQPLHGTFLIDAKGQVLWQDISYEPFKDDEFLLQEAQRLLKVRQ